MPDGMADARNSRRTRVRMKRLSATLISIVSPIIPAVLGSLVFVGATSAAGAGIPKAHGQHWEIAGQLSEACSCAVPCTCNFNEPPSPHHYCWSLFSLDIKRGHYGSVSLDGLHLVGAHGKKGNVWYIDQSATPEQAAALHTITLDLDRDAHKAEHWETATITQVVGEKSHEVEVEGHGGFKANYIIGLDGNSPVVVENNSSWNIQHGVKAKARELAYHDQYGNRFTFKGVNSNEGNFDWTDETPKYF
jgi:hypothetical protein